MKYLTKKVQFILVIMFAATGLGVGTYLGAGNSTAKLADISLPTIILQTAGAPTVGEVLSSTQGGWQNGPTSFSYNWQSCTTPGSPPTGCTSVQSSSSNSYTIAQGDLGKVIYVIVTASNIAGSATASAAATGVVSAGSSLQVGTGPDQAQCAGSCTATISAPSPLGANGTGNWSWNGSTATVSSCTTYAWSGPITVLPGNTTTPSVNGSAERCQITAAMSTDGAVSPTHYFFVEQPVGLDVHNANNPVPVIFVWPDSCVPESATPGCFTVQLNSATPSQWTDNGPPSWEAWDANASNLNKYLIVAIYGWNTASYTTGYLYPGASGSACGSGSFCDQGFQAIAVLNWLKSRFAINTNQVWDSGGSKGGTFAHDIICNPNVGPHFTGTAIGSHILRSNTGFSSYPTGALPPPAQMGGTCGELVANNTSTLPDPAPNATPVMISDWFGVNDTGQTCTNTQGIPPAAGHATPPFTTAGLYSESIPAQTSGFACYRGGGVSPGGTSISYGGDTEATQITGPAFGCSATPTKGVPAGQSGATGAAGTNGTVNIGGGQVYTRTYYGCRNNGNFIGAVQVVDFNAGGSGSQSSCHAFACSSNGGSTLGVQIAQQQEDFFLNGSAS